MLTIPRRVLALLLTISGLVRMSAETAEEALAAALERRDAASVQAAFDAGADIRFSRRPFLALAAQTGKPEIVRILLEHHSRLDLPALDLGPPLEAAIATRDSAASLAIVDLLLTAGALDKSGDHGGRALFLACRDNQLETARRLLQAGARIDGRHEQTPALHQIIRRPVIDEAELEPAVQILLNAGADPAQKDAKGLTPGDVAAESGLPRLLGLFEPGNSAQRDLAAVRQRALDRQLLVAISRHNSSRIHWSTPQPNQPGPQLESIQRALANGANPRAVLKLWGEWERSALGILLDHSTAPPYEADPAVLDLLLTHGATWEDLGRNRDRRFREALDLPQLAEVLLKHGLKPDQPVPVVADRRDPRQAATMTTALHAAATSGNVNLATALLERGGNVDSVDADGYTPLARAVAAGRESTTELLLKRGASIATKTTSGLTLADLAAQANNRRRLKLWDEKGTYRELIEAYTPPPKSRWAGTWATGTKEFPSPVTLEPDGGGSYGGANIMWTETGDGIRLRMGTGLAIREMNLAADAQGNLQSSVNPGGFVLTLWRPDHPPADKPPGPVASSARLQATIDEQLAALASGRSDGFSPDSNLKLDGFPDRIRQERRWKRMMIQGGELRALPAGLGGMPMLEDLTICNQSDLEIEPGALDLPALAILRLERTGLKNLPLRWERSPALRELQVYDSRLTSLPAGWAGARSLVAVGFANSRIRTLPDDIGKAPVLKRLGVGGNQLTSLPDSLGNPVIEELYLTDNRFTSIPPVITHMTRLRALDLSRNRITAFDSTELPVTLKTLNLSGNELTAVPDLRHCANLESVDLSANLIQSLPDEDGWLPPSVVELSLWTNRLATMPPWLSTRAFRRLNLNGNRWPDDAARRVSREAEERWRQSAASRRP